MFMCVVNLESVNKLDLTWKQSFLINGLNTNIFFYSDTSGGSSSNLYLNVVHFFYTAVNWTSVADQGTCFPALVSNTAEAVFLVVCDLSMN